MIHIKTLIDALGSIADSEHNDNYRVTLNPLIKIENGKIITKNDEFVIKSAEIENANAKFYLQTNLVIKAFIRLITTGTKDKNLLLKGESGSFVRIKILTEQTAIIEF